MNNNCPTHVSAGSVHLCNDVVDMFLGLCSCMVCRRQFLLCTRAASGLPAGVCVCVCVVQRCTQ